MSLKEGSADKVLGHIPREGQESKNEAHTSTPNFPPQQKPTDLQVPFHIRARDAQEVQQRRLWEQHLAQWFRCLGLGRWHGCACGWVGQECGVGGVALFVLMGGHLTFEGWVGDCIVVNKAKEGRRAGMLTYRCWRTIYAQVVGRQWAVQGRQWRAFGGALRWGWKEEQGRDDG
ncbi:hypothetical protein B0H17DRAFT_1146120 [Mycena rosella]|uniref:Uncharacterized protein n=1 Tax=Mycena rosella TaxID=1033263 RepID=A0AAD7CPJ2_MYCRO|nr:hypothetical protein B0H17DRAFT_1146120 [Mycena rosella]